MSKYHARKVTADGITFDSLAEHRRYEELKLWQASGGIAGLEVHRRIPLEVNRINCGYYEADFVYQVIGGRMIVEDVKGVRTAVYRLKKKLVKAIHDLDITEVEA